MAGAIAELAKRALAADFRTIDPRDARIVLVEAGPRLLAAFDPSLSDYAEAARSKRLRRRGPSRTRAVTHCDADGVALGDERIESRTIVWAAGVQRLAGRRMARRGDRPRRPRHRRSRTSPCPATRRSS